MVHSLVMTSSRLKMALATVVQAACRAKSSDSSRLVSPNFSSSPARFASALNSLS